MSEQTKDAAQTPWAYRPLEYDEWGFIRNREGRVVAKARPDHFLSIEDEDAHRLVKTDPCEHYARLIVRAVNAFDSMREALKAALRLADDVGGDEAYEQIKAALDLAGEP
jgi:hypothetical protein